MPRLTDQVRASRRLQIADAALRCFARQGIGATTMADIIKESGLSAGSIYSHFGGRSDLVSFTVSTLLDDRAHRLVDIATAMSEPPGPGKVVELLLREVLPEGMPAILGQLVGQVHTEPELLPTVRATMGRVQAMVAEALTPWARTQATGEATDEAAVERLAMRTASIALAVMHGYVLRLTVEPDDVHAELRSDLVGLLDGQLPTA